MAYYYFPSCKATAQFKEASKKARAYVKEQFGIKTERVACYCKFCTDAINMGGKQGVHLLDLLFPAQTED